MSQQSILSKLSKLIEGNPTYIVEGRLNKNLLAADARKYDKDLLNTLQKDKDIKEHFFTQTDGGLVFKKGVFLQFISNKEFLPDSFTKYRIKIGLGGNDGALLQESGDVVLNWPYKDAVLDVKSHEFDLDKTAILNNKHISSILKSKIGFSINSISFNSVNSKIGEYLLNYKKDLNVLGQINENFWNNKKTLQLVVRDLII